MLRQALNSSLASVAKLLILKKRRLFEKPGSPDIDRYHIYICGYDIYIYIYVYVCIHITDAARQSCFQSSKIMPSDCWMAFVRSKFWILGSWGFSFCSCKTSSLDGPPAPCQDTIQICRIVDPVKGVLFMSYAMHLTQRIYRYAISVYSPYVPLGTHRCTCIWSVYIYNLYVGMCLCLWSILAGIYGMCIYSIYLSIHPSMHPSIYPSIHTYIYIYV